MEGDVAFFAHAYANRPISIHALRVEGDCTPLHACSQLPVFLSTPSGWRATRDIWDIRDAETISIHALRVEGDLVLCGSIAAGCDFYPRPPGGGRPAAVADPSAALAISIHALRVEGDGCRHLTTDKSCYFYPRPPGGGRRLRVDRPKLEDCRFLSTPSGWRATHYGRNAECNRKFLSTPSGWRATADSLCCLGCGHISIHALRVEGDPKQNYAVSMFVRTFLSTPSGWRATGVNKEISTTQKHFYPRPPGGGRHGREE